MKAGDFVWFYVNHRTGDRYVVEATTSFRGRMKLREMGIKDDLELQWSVPLTFKPF